MYVLATNMWFSSLMRQFFFWIDKIVFNFISSIYDVLIAIARTSVFTQSDFAELSDRIYKLLAVFMVFKVTLSLITYVVNPDNFTEKSKGVYKLSTNIIISLAMLILTPYIFSYAYEVQTILLEDNSLGVLILGGDDNNAIDSVFNTAGDDIAYTAMSPFFTPNVSLVSNCTILLTGEAGEKVFNSDCSGITDGKTNADGTLYGLTVDNEKYFSEQTLKTYVAGVEKGNLGLMFRQDMALATANKNSEFVMDYKFLFSTATGIIIVLLLVTFCMDIGVRSIKLAFLQLIAPVPIISYIDPKKGKDGMFKKWGEMCFKTYLSLFIRLIALYFAVFIIEKIADGQLVDVVDGSYITNPIIYVFIIIGALMFAKQLPKILEGLGIKLDGDGKFSLNPLKKMEDNMIGGKNIRKAAKYAARPVKGLATAGLVTGKSLVTGQGFRGGMTAMKGAMKGEKFGKNFSTSYSAAKAGKKKVDEMEANGVKRRDVWKDNLYNAFHGSTRADQVKQVADKSKAIQSTYDAIKNQAIACDAYNYDENGNYVRSAKTISKELDELNKTQIDRSQFKDKIGKTADQQYREAVDAKNIEIANLTAEKAKAQARISDIDLESTKLKTEKANLNRDNFSSDAEFNAAQTAYQQKIDNLANEKNSYNLNELDSKIAQSESERDSLSVDSYTDEETITAEEQYRQALSEQSQMKADMEKELENRINDLANGRVQAKDSSGNVVQSAQEIITQAREDMIALTAKVNELGEELDPGFVGIDVEVGPNGFDVVTAMKQSKGTAGITNVGTMADITTRSNYTRDKKSK